MAGTSLIALIDDIATILDDVSVLTKIAAKKTAGVLGDDLALNAEQVSGVSPDRELPVVWAVAKGSFKNKLILVPGALAVSAVAPWLITPMLMVGGGYLCYEGFEKLAHLFFHSKEEDKAHLDKNNQNSHWPEHRSAGNRKEKNTGSNPDRFCSLFRDNRDRPGYGQRRTVYQSGSGRFNYRPDHDDWCLWPGCGYCQA